LLARRFHALSDPTRLAILDALRAGECCVCDLQGALEAAQSRLSFHLRVLKDAGLISQRKDGRWSWYQLTPGVLGEISAALQGLGGSGARALPLYPSSDAVKGSIVRDASVESDASGCCG
jgi:ArsR family transcriptional regulator